MDTHTHSTQPHRMLLPAPTNATSKIAITMATPSIHPSSGCSTTPTMNDTVAAATRIIRMGSRNVSKNSFQKPLNGGSGNVFMPYLQRRPRYGLRARRQSSSGVRWDSHDSTKHDRGSREDASLKGPHKQDHRATSARLTRHLSCSNTCIPKPAKKACVHDATCSIQQTTVRMRGSMWSQSAAHATQPLSQNASHTTSDNPMMVNEVKHPMAQPVRRHGVIR